MITPMFLYILYYFKHWHFNLKCSGIIGQKLLGAMISNNLITILSQIRPLKRSSIHD